MYPYGYSYPSPAWHPLARTTFAGVDGGECTADVLKITWPSDVDDFKQRLVPIAAGIDSSVQACAGLTAADKASWSSTFATWSAFAAKKTPLFGSSNEWQTTCSYARTFDAWRAKLAGVNCQIAGPAEIQVQQTNPLDLVRWVVIGTGVIGGVALAIAYMPEIKLAVGKVLKR